MQLNKPIQKKFIKQLKILLKIINQLFFIYNNQIEENELQLQPIYVNDVIQNEYKEINLYITNLQNRGIKLQRIQSEYKKVSLISVLDQELSESQDNSNNNKSDYIIDLDKYPLQKNIKDKNIARILLKTEETGIFKDVIILTCSNNKFAIPIQFRVSNSVRFYKEYIDFGVIGVYNENQIQAFDLDLKKYDCLKENQKLIIKPGEQNRKIGKMNIIGKVLSNEYMNNEPIRYFGKLFLITNETQSQNNYLNFAFTIIKNPITHEPGLFNFYINPDNLPQTQQYYDQIQDKNIQYVLFDKQKGVQQVSIRKQVILRGLGKNYLKIYEVIPESSYFHVEGVKQIQDSDSNISYAFDLKYVREFKYATNFNQISYLKLQISSEQTILPIQIMVYDKSLYCKTGSKEQPLFTIKQGQIATFSFVLNATMESNVESEVIFRTSQENFTIPLSYQIIPGQVLVEPSILKFEQSFKGIQSQYSVELENTFKEPINIKSITSEDDRFYFKYDHNLQIQPGQKTKAFEIFFNSSFWQDDVPISLDQNYENKIKKILSGITYKDLNKHFKQVMEWQQFQMQQKNDIRSKIKIETSYVQEVILEVQVNMTQPIIIKENKIDFGLNQINQKINKPITIFNPSDYPLHLSFFISTSDFFQNSYLKQLSNKSQKSFGVQKFSVCAPEIEKYRSFEFYKNLNLIFVENGSNNQIQEYIIKAKDNGYSVKYPMDPIKNTFKSKKEVKNLIGEDFYGYLQKEKTLICKQGNIDNIQKHLIQREHLMRPLIYLYQNPSADKKTGQQQFYLGQNQQIVEIPPHSNYTFNDLYYEPQFGSVSATLFIKNILTGLNLIPLYGQGGIGQLEIISLYQVENKKEKKQKTLIENLNTEEMGINGNLNFIFQVKPQDLSENGFQIMCQREFTLQNTGKLPVEIKKITQNQNEPCESGFFKMNCNGFKLEPGEQKAFPITLIQSVQDIFDNQNDNLKQQFNTSLQFYAENYYFNFQLYVDYSEFLLNLKQQAHNNEEQKLYWSKRLKGNQPNFLPYYAKIAIFSSLILFVITIYNFLTHNIIKAQKKQFGAKRIVSKLNNISNYSILERQVGFKVQLKSQQSNNQVYNIKAFIEKAKKNKDRYNKNSYNYQQQDINNKVHISSHISSEIPEAQIQSKQKKNSQNLQEQTNNLQQNTDIDNINNIKTKPKNNSENQNIIKNQKDIVNQENIQTESENQELIQNNKNFESSEKKLNQITEQEAQVPIPKQKNKKMKKQEKKHKKKDQNNKQNDETGNQREQNQNNKINAEERIEKVEKKQKDDSIILSHNQSQVKDSDASFSQNLEEEQNQSKISSQKDLLNKSLSNKSAQNYHKYENKYIKQGHHQKNYSYSNKQQQQKQQQQINFDDNGFIDLQKKVPVSILKPANLIFPQLQLKATSKQKEKQIALKNEWEEENIDLVLNEGKQEKNVIDENEFKKIDEEGQIIGKNSQNIDKKKDYEQKKQTNQENLEKLKEEDSEKQQQENNMKISQKIQEAKQEVEKFNELEKSQTKMESPKIINNQQDQLNQQSFISQEKLEEEENSDIDLNIENENENYNSDSDDQLGSGESLNEEEKFDDKNNFGFGIQNELEKIESQSSEQQLQFQQQQQQQQETQQLDQSLEFSKFQNDFFYQNKDSKVSQQKEEDSSNAVSEDDEINFKYFNLFKGGNKESKFKSFLQNKEESLNEQEQQKNNIDIRSQNKTQTLFGAQGNLNFYNDKKLSQQQYLNNSQSNNSDSDLSSSQNHLNLGKLDSNQSSNNNSFGIQEQLKINKLEKNMKNSKNPFSAFFGNHHENPSVDINESGIFSNNNNKQDDQVYVNEDQTQAFSQISQNLQKQQNQQQSPLFDPQEAQQFNQQIKNQDFYDQQQQFQNNDNLKSNNNNNSYFQPKIIPQVNQIDQNFSYSQQLSFQNPMLMYSYLQQQQSISDNFPNQMGFENNEEAEEEQKDLSYKDDSAHISQDEQVSGRQKLENYNRNFNNNNFNSSQNYSQNPYSSDSSSNQKGSFQGSDYKSRKNQTKKPSQYEETKQQQDKNIYQQQSSQSFYSNNGNYPFNNYGNNNNLYQDQYDDEEDEEDEYYQDYNTSNNYRYTNKNTSFNTQNSNIRYQKSYQPSSRQNFSSKYQASSNQNRNYNSGYKSSKVINQGQNQSYQKTTFKKSSFTSGKGLRQGFNKYQNPSNSNSNINSSQNTGKQHGSFSHSNKPHYQNNNNNNNSYFQYDYQNYQEESDGGGNSYQQGPPSKFNKKKDFSIQRPKKPFRGKPHYSRQDPDYD
ncbi:hypothetical protein PPERSA_12652 [Pseudocohnilembus persalinus]|uniref:Uncharacterized protein n=1 Tax=Pseudocohnilembus persalinus TaxID=266149 RepID=A0A0V0QMD0_PSEPJ|nr:hypothetical protein PPERSA_12652 [Pseudocohnilembus persalinus]|eukprot:KRX03373.1 hypothetical protein PPERSA_12652 [Pseudocohnilembus persalinus]